jgi:hypothetical protein
MRSLTRVSVLMGPPSLAYIPVRSNPERAGNSGGSTPTISEKALQMQGPMPTDHGLNWSNRLRNAQNMHLAMPVTGPICLENSRDNRWEWDSS